MCPVGAIQNQENIKSSPPTKDSKPQGNKKAEGEDQDRLETGEPEGPRHVLGMHIKIDTGTRSPRGMIGGLLGLGAFLSCPPSS